MYLSRCRIALASLFLFGLSACFPTSQHPIAGDPSAAMPGVFSGIWDGALVDGPVTLLFMEPDREESPAPQIKGLLIRHHEDRPSINEGWLEFEANVTVIRDEIFLSILLIQTDGKPTEANERGYFLFRLLLSGETFKVIGMDDMVTAELVDRGALDGTVDRTYAVPIVRLTSDGEDLRGFLSNADLSEVFSEPFAEFTRRR